MHPTMNEGDSVSISSRFPVSPPPQGIIHHRSSELRVFFSHGVACGSEMVVS